MTATLKTRTDTRGVAYVTLNKPEVHNAFDAALVGELTALLKKHEANPKVRLVVLAAEGKSFSAGADLRWMREMSLYSEEQNLADARALAGLMATLDRLAKPTLALVRGPAYGGGVGLIACCDIALAVDSATFALTEVRLGLVPAVISPYVIAAIGARAARRYFLTAERFSAIEAEALGLVHLVVTSSALEDTADKIVCALLAGGPAALAEAKRLVPFVAARPGDRTLDEELAALIARIRAGAEGKEGLSAFLEKRKPRWQG
ncbi:MAG: enoyl-CoA hydratase-related protein [Kiloniellales bacterium]